ncbi:glutamate formimidoyltransferase [Candidatus Nitrospira bockiana]
MEPLVECVPNFSEGRDPAKVQALTAAARSVPGVILLDQEMDADHHRSVLTFVGPPDAVAEAAFRCAETAMRSIDLRGHQGGHPRVGATDVIPFVPIRGVAMEACVALARRVGQRIGQELGIPVFLYERAATREERTQLEAIRRGGPDGLAQRMQDPAWAPDFGPPYLHPTAGATIVGARPPLIAYNVNLGTEDLAVAKAIAKTVRFSSGGLPFVKAIGVPLESRRLVQVSMNLTNFQATPIHVAYDAVRREAERHRVEVIESEIVGLVPQQALVQTAQAALKLTRFDPMQILETRLETALARETGEQREDLGRSVSSFLSALAAGTPTPGGGSVAALAGALAGSLGLMVCRLGPPKSASSEEGEVRRRHLADAEERLTRLTARLQALIQEDADAYGGVMEAYRLPKTDPRRSDAIAEKLIAAARVPLETAELASETAQALLRVRQWAKPSASSDLSVGVLMARAAIEGGVLNVRENVKGIENQPVVLEMLARTERIEQSLVDLQRLC